MASFTQQPAEHVSCYRPIKFRFESGSTSDAVEKAYIELYNSGGTLLASYRKDWTSRTGSGPYNYIFDFDISGFLQARLDPVPSAKSGVILHPDAVVATSTNGSLGVYVKAQIEIRNANNLLEASGSQITSDTIYAFNIIRQFDEDQTLDEFVDATFRSVLIEQPLNGIDIRTDENFFYCFIVNEDVAKARYNLYEADGTLTQEEIAITIPSGSTYHNKRIAAVSVGPRLANNYFTLDSQYVRFDVFMADSGGTALTQSISFNLVERCPGRELRLHWLNSRGGVGAYTFNAVKRENVEAKSSSAEKPITWGFSTFDPNQRGRYRTNIERADYWELESRVVTEDIGEYLAGLLASPEVYVEQIGESFYLPVVVEDGRIITADTEEVGVIVKMKISLANKKSVQRY